MIIDVRSEPTYVHTVPLYTRDDHGIPVLLGTSVFVNFAGNRCLLSARHVVQDDKTQMFYPTDNRLVGLDARLSFPHITNERGEVSQIDLAVIEIRDPAPDDLARFFTPFDLGRTDAVLRPECGMPCKVVGFPATKTVYHNDKRLSNIPMCINTEITTVSNNVFANFAVQFTRDRKRGALARYAPQPFGMSGCGAWFLDSNNLIHLIGLAHHYEKAPSNRIICVSVSDLLR